MPGHYGGQPLLSPPPHWQLPLPAVVTAAAVVATAATAPAAAIASCHCCCSAAAAVGIATAFVVTAATDFTPYKLRCLRELR